MPNPAGPANYIKERLVKQNPQSAGTSIAGQSRFNTQEEASAFSKGFSKYLGSRATWNPQQNNLERENTMAYGIANAQGPQAQLKQKLLRAKSKAKSPFFSETSLALMGPGGSTRSQSTGSASHIKRQLANRRPRSTGSMTPSVSQLQRADGRNAPPYPGLAGGQGIFNMGNRSTASDWMNPSQFMGGALMQGQDNTRYGAPPAASQPASAQPAPAAPIYGPHPETIQTYPSQRIPLGALPPWQTEQPPQQAPSGVTNALGNATGMRPPSLAELKYYYQQAQRTVKAGASEVSSRVPTQVELEHYYQQAQKNVMAGAKALQPVGRAINNALIKNAGVGAPSAAELAASYGNAPGSVGNALGMATPSDAELRDAYGIPQRVRSTSAIQLAGPPQRSGPQRTPLNQNVAGMAPRTQDEIRAATSDLDSVGLGDGTSLTPGSQQQMTAGAQDFVAKQKAQEKRIAANPLIQALNAANAQRIAPRPEAEQPSRFGTNQAYLAEAMRDKNPTGALDDQYTGSPGRFANPMYGTAMAEANARREEDAKNSLSFQTQYGQRSAPGLIQAELSPGDLPESARNFQPQTSAGMDAMRSMQLQGNKGYRGAVDSARTSLDAARQGQYIPTQAMTVMGGIGSQTPQSASPASAVAQDRYGLGTDATMADAFQARSVQRDQAKRNQFASLGARQQMVTRNAQNRAGRRRGQAALPQLTRPQAEYLATVSSGGEPTMSQAFAAGGKEPAMATQEYSQKNLMNSLLNSAGGPELITQAMANPDTPLGKLITAWMSGGGKTQGKVAKKPKTANEKAPSAGLPDIPSLIMDAPPGSSWSGLFPSGDPIVF